MSMDFGSQHESPQRAAQGERGLSRQIGDLALQRREIGEVLTLGAADEVGTDGASNACEPAIAPFPLWLRFVVLTGSGMACWAGLLSGLGWLTAALGR